jgi:hypothetical protein
LNNSNRFSLNRLKILNHLSIFRVVRYEDQSKQSHFIYLFLIALVFLINEIFINPIGDFPLNDDWWYAIILKKFHFSGTFDPNMWGSSSLMTQIMIAKAFVSVFGFSFTVLRFCTLIISLAACLFFYFILTGPLKQEKRIAFAITLLFLFNPLFLCLSNTFMTEVYFVGLCLAGIFYYLHYLNEKKTHSIILAFIFLFLAMYERQVALAFFIGILITEFIVFGKLKRNLLILFLALVSLFFFEKWLQSGGGFNMYAYLFYPKGKSGLVRIALWFGKRWIYYVVLSGFVLFPLLLPFLWWYFKNRIFLRDKKIFFCSVLLFIAVCTTIREFPIDNYLYDSGVGPETSFDTFILKTNRHHASAPLLMSAISVLAYTCSFAVIVILLQSAVNLWYSLKKKDKPVYPLFFFSSIFIYYSFLSTTPAMFDRYTLIFSVLFLVLALPHLPLNQYRIQTGIAFILLAFYSACATKDYLNDYKTRWDAISFVKKNTGCSDSEINGGYEHSGLLFSDKGASWLTKWTNNEGNNYIIAYGPVKGYGTYSYFTYKRCIPFKQDSVFILKKY